MKPRRSRLNALTLVQAAALVGLTVLGAYAAQDAPRAGATKPDCVTLTPEGCVARP